MFSKLKPEKLKWVFFIVWLTSIFVFFGIVANQSGNQIYKVWATWGIATSLIVGVVSFLLTIAFSLNLFRKRKKQKPKGVRIQSNLFRPLLVALVLLLSTSTFLLGKSSSNVLKSNTKSSGVPTPTISPTATPKAQGTTAPKKQAVVSDPIIDCVSSHPNCNGETIRLKKSQCSQIYCCGFSDGRWVLYSSKQKCETEAGKIIQPQQVQKPTTPTNQLNFYCYDNTYKYSYYTSSGEQCNKDNLRSSCLEFAKLSVWNPCSQKCKDTDMENINICLAAYSGSNALIEDNFELYQQCSSESTGEFTKCLDACGPSYQDAMSKCN